MLHLSYVHRLKSWKQCKHFTPANLTVTPYPYATVNMVTIDVYLQNCSYLSEVQNGVYRL